MQEINIKCDVDEQWLKQSLTRQEIQRRFIKEKYGKERTRMMILELHERDTKETVELFCRDLEIHTEWGGDKRGFAIVDTLPFTGNAKIKKVIFNNPATIVFWEDGTKTVVKCMEGDTFSKEMGLAMCICKKVLGSQYHRVFKEWVTYEPE